MKVIKEFKEFALRGNVVDLAVGIIIGGAFNGIVQSLVKDVILPPIGLILGKVDFSGLFINLGGGDYKTIAEAQLAKAPTFNYDLFINNIIVFTITAFAVFLLVKGINKLRRNEQKNQQILILKIASSVFLQFCLRRHAVHNALRSYN